MRNTLTLLVLALLLATCAAFAAAPPGAANENTAPAITNVTISVSCDGLETLAIVDSGQDAAKMAMTEQNAVNNATRDQQVTLPNIAKRNSVQSTENTAIAEAIPNNGTNATAAGSSPTGVARSGPSNTAMVAVPAEEVHLGD